MYRLLKNSILATAVAATTLATLPAAQAGDSRHGRHHAERQDDNTDVIIAGLLGLAVGAIVVGAIGQPDQRGPFDRDPYDDVEFASGPGYFPPAPDEPDPAVFEQPEAPEVYDPETREWYKYCEDSYRVFKRTAIVDGEYQRFSCAE